jgi:hypothetical protein
MLYAWDWAATISIRDGKQGRTTAFNPASFAMSFISSTVHAARTLTGPSK